MAKRAQIKQLNLGGQLSGLNQVLQAIRESIEVSEGERGDPLDRSVKVRDLVDAGVTEYVLTRRGSGQYANLTAPSDQGVITLTPPTPQNLTASPTTANVYLSWDRPNYSFHAYTEIWRSTEDNLSTAIDIGASPDGMIFSDAVRSGVTYYYWIRFVSFAGKKSEFNAVDGTEATAAVAPEYLLEQLSERITASELVEDLRSPIELIPALGTAVTTEIEERIQADINEAKARAEALEQEAEQRTIAVKAEADQRALDIRNEAEQRAQALLDESQLRINQLNQQRSELLSEIQSEAESRKLSIENETLNRTQALIEEAEKRTEAIQAESENRADAILNEAQKRVSDFQALQGLSRLTANEARDIQLINRISNEEISRIQSYQELSASFLTQSSNAHAEIVRLDEVIAKESESRATSITQLKAEFENSLGDAREAAVEEAINIVTSNDDVIAEVISKISAADNTGWATIHYVDQSVLTPLNALTTRTEALENSYQALGSEYVSNSSFLDYQQSNATDQQVVSEQLSSLESTINNPSTGLSSKASTTQLTQAKNDIYNSSINQFGQISASFNQVNEQLESKVEKTELTDAIANADQARLKTLNQTITALEKSDFSAQVEQIKSIQQTASAEIAQATRLDRIESEYKTGLSAAAASISETYQTLSDETQALSESIETHKATYESDKQTSLASKTELNQALANEQEARSRELSSLDAELKSDINTRATKDELSQAIAGENEATATTIAELEAALQGDINTRVKLTELNEALASEQQSRATQLSTLQAELQGDIDSKASKSDLSEAIANAEQARLTLSENINLEFQEQSSEIGNRATKTEVQTLSDSVASGDKALNSKIDQSLLTLQKDDVVSKITDLRTIQQVAQSDLSQMIRLDRMESEYKTGISRSLASISEASRLLTNETSSLAETITTHKAEYEADKQNVLANKTELSEAIASESESRVTALSALEAELQGDIDTRARTTELNEAIASEQQVRASQLDELEANLQGDIDTRATKTELSDAVATEQEARSTNLSALKSELLTDIETRATKTALNESIANEQGARAQALSDLESELLGDINSRATTTELNQAIASEQESRSTAINTLEAELQGNIDTRARTTELNEAIANEQQARVSQVANLEASLQDDIDTRATKAELSNAVATEQESRVSALNTLQSSLQSDINSRATIGQLNEAMSTEQESRASSLSSLEATLTTDINTRATKVELSNAIASEQESRSSQIAQLTTTVDGHAATLQNQSESINGLQTKWGVKFSIGEDGQQRVSGFQMNGTAEETGAHFDVDTFSVGKPGAESLDLAVADVAQPDGSTKRMVVMDAANLVNLVVTNAMIEGLSADKITTGKLTSERIDTSTLIAQQATSPNYVAETQGWNLAKDGSAEFNNGVFRGHVEASSGEFHGAIYAQTGVFKGTISGAYMYDTTIIEGTSDRYLICDWNQHAYGTMSPTEIVNSGNIPIICLQTLIGGTTTSNTISYSVSTDTGFQRSVFDPMLLSVVPMNHSPFEITNRCRRESITVDVHISIRSNDEIDKGWRKNGVGFELHTSELAGGSRIVYSFGYDLYRIHSTDGSQINLEGVVWTTGEEEPGLYYMKASMTIPYITSITPVLFLGYSNIYNAQGRAHAHVSITVSDLEQNL